MRAIQGHIRVRQLVRGIIARRRLWRGAAILLFVLLAQLAPFGSHLPLGVSGPTLAHAATAWYVDQNTGADTNSCASSSSPCQTIGGAIGKAASGDTININPGTYNEHLTIPGNLTLSGAGASSTIIDGTGSGTVVTVPGGATVTISGVTIQHGSATTGGGINNSAGSLTLANVVVASNTATANGAGIYTGAGTVTAINNSSITGNTINSTTVRVVSGGGIYNQGTFTIDRSTIANNLAKTELSSRNTASISASAAGGGIDNLGTLIMSNSAVINNSAAYPDAAAPAACPGGGGSLPAGDCFGTAAGAGIANEAAGTLTVTNSTVSGNNVTTDDGNGLGGGIWNAGGTLNLTNATISANTVSVFVGPAFAASFAYGGGLAVGSSATAVSMRATIFANNTFGGGGSFNGPDCSTNFATAGTSVTSQGYNLIRDTSSCSIGGNTTGNITGQDPLLGPLQNNGGPTLTQLPDVTSPAIGAVASGCPSTDQRSDTRPQALCTIGAVEVSTNGDWVHAQNVSDPSTNGVQTVSQAISTQGQERWYYFPAHPGSTVHISLNGAAGSVITLHRDLKQIYNSLTNPSSTSTLANDLAIRDAPSGYLPSGYLPSGYLPSGYLPGPYASAPSQGLMAIASDPNATVLNIDRNTWDLSENLYVRVAGPPGSFTVTFSESGGVCSGVQPVSGPAPTIQPTTVNNGQLPQTLILWDSSRIAGSAAATATLTSDMTAFASRPDVLGQVVDLNNSTNFQRLAAANQQADATSSCPAAKNLVADEIKSIVQGYRNAYQANGQTTLKYIVLIGDDHSIPFFRYPDESGLAPENGYVPPVSDSSATQASLRQNYVLGQDEYGATNDIARGDHSIPLPNLAVGRLVATASDASRMLEAYMATGGVITPTSALVTGYDFVADAAISATAEISAGINQAGCAALGTCVTPDQLILPQGVAPSDPSAWTASQLSQQLLGSRHDIVFLAGHFSAGNLLASDYSTQLSAATVASSTANLSNTLVLALGCHGGLNIPDGDAISGVSPSPDWPQALAQKGATLLAATGYAYGDTVLTEYGERLFVDVARQLRTGNGRVSIGQANVAAKDDYLASHITLGGIDEKTVLETTLYGLPMLQINMTGQRLPIASSASIVGSTVAIPATQPGGQVGLVYGQQNGSTDIDVSPALVTHTVQLTKPDGSTVTAKYLSGASGVVANPLDPIFPLQMYNASVPGQSSLILRGIGFRGGAFSDTGGVTPLTVAPATENSVGHPAFVSDVFYPTQVWSANYFDALDGGVTRLAVAPAQYKSDPGSIAGTLRQFSDLKFRLYYLDSSAFNNLSSAAAQAALAPAPNIAAATATDDGSGNVTFNVRIQNPVLLDGFGNPVLDSSGNPVYSIQDVWVTYADMSTHRWVSVDLVKSPNDPTLFTATASGSGLSASANTSYIVQAANAAGLVSLSTNNGTYFTVMPLATAGTVPATPSVSLQSPPSSGAYQSSAAFKALLQKPDGSALPNQIVGVRIGNQEVEGVTGSDGSATITVPLAQTPGTYTLTASYAGGNSDGAAYANASSQPGSFMITPATTTLSLLPASASTRYSDNAPLTATLTATPTASGPNVPLTQKSVFFTVSGNGQTYYKSVITDDNGQAALGTVPLPSGTYSVSATYNSQLATSGGITTEQDPYYKSASASGASLTVIPEMAGVAYSGDTLDPISATVHLTATVARLDDTFLNDLTLAQVQFAAVDPTGKVVATTTAPVAVNGVATATLPGTLLSNVYIISTTVVGSYFTSATATPLLAVYNPNGGFVTGGGWITSQPGWCQLSSCSSSAGQANFGFNARYKSGTTIPTGQAGFQLAGLDLESTSYQWMTISGNRVQFQGTGTVNGSGSYNFMVTAIDTDMGGPQNGTDYFRMKIWNPSTGAVIYDSQPDAPDTSNPTTPLGGGNIVIHAS